MRLYRSSKYSTRWFAFTPQAEWVMFPAEWHGWDKRQPARGIESADIREVPLRLGFNTGIPGAPCAWADSARQADAQLGVAA